MSKLKIFIIEDDFLHANRAEMYLDEMGYEIAGLATSAPEALNKISATKPDLLLVDIDIEGDTDGVQLVEKLNSKNPIPSIFVTSFKDKTTIDRAKLTQPYAYIIKPYEKETLQAAIELAVFKFSQTSDFISINNDSHGFKGWESDRLVKESFFIKSKSMLVKINFNDILFIEVKDKFCLITTTDETIEARIALKELASKLSKGLFSRIHRSFIINTEKIEQIDLNNNQVKIATQLVPIGRSYKEAFINSLDTL